MLSKTSASTLAFCSLLLLTGARGCDPDVPIGEECAPDSCGPALLSPAIMCEDGSIGGNTGRCLATAGGTCGWEIRECPPPPECTPSDCGPPPPGLPGTPAVECRRQGDVCRWTVGDSCMPEDCGPAPGRPSYICEDGSLGGFTGRCLMGADMLCGWEIRECTAGECTVEECGPAPGAASFLCSDGSWGGPTGCSRSAGGTCGYGWRDCPPPVSCEDPTGCPEGFHCAADGTCHVGRGCGAMTCDPAAQYCERSIAGIPGSPDVYECLPLPSACAASPSCAACFDGTAGAVCTEDASGIQVTSARP